METQKNPIKCWDWFDRKHKKVLFILGGIVMLAVAALSIAAAGWKMREARNYGYGNMMYGYDNTGREQTMNGRKGVYPVAPDIDNQFVLPSDALKNGELAIMVDDLEAAKGAVSDIALRNNGKVYATFISYASNNVKNGTIVVQIPADEFDFAFSDLRKIGNRLVQESTQIISKRNIYPVPMSSAERATDAIPADDVILNENSASSSETVGMIAKPEMVIYPAPYQYNQVQDKGYIKIVFVDYGVGSSRGLMMQRNDVAGSIIPVGRVEDRNVKNNLLIVVGIKLVLLVVIFGLLIMVFKKILSHILRKKEHKRIVHVVRQVSKPQARIVRIQKRK